MFIRHPKPQLKRCQSEPQLKECHVFALYPKPQLKGYRYEPQLKEHSSKYLFKELLKPCRPHTYKANKYVASALSPSATLESPGETQFQTTWHNPFVARHQAPLNPLLCWYRLAERPSSASATRSNTPLIW